MLRPSRISHTRYSKFLGSRAKPRPTSNAGLLDFGPRTSLRFLRTSRILVLTVPRGWPNLFAISECVRPP